VRLRKLRLRELGLRESLRERSVLRTGIPERRSRWGAEGGRLERWPLEIEWRRWRRKSVDWLLNAELRLRWETAEGVSIKELYFAGGRLLERNRLQLATAKAQRALLKLLKLSSKLRQVLPGEAWEKLRRISGRMQRGWRRQKSGMLRKVGLRGGKLRRESSGVKSGIGSSMLRLLSFGLVSVFRLFASKRNLQSSSGNVHFLRVRVDNATEGGAGSRSWSGQWHAGRTVTWSWSFLRVQRSSRGHRRNWLFVNNVVAVLVLFVFDVKHLDGLPGPSAVGWYINRSLCWKGVVGILDDNLDNGFGLLQDYVLRRMVA